LCALIRAVDSARRLAQRDAVENGLGAHDERFSQPLVPASWRGEYKIRLSNRIVAPATDD
jgi:hypothetical protein